MSGRVTGSAFALAEVSTSASCIDNFNSEIKVLVDKGKLLTIALCVSESFFSVLGDMWGIYCRQVFTQLTGV